MFGLKIGIWLGVGQTIRFSKTPPYVVVISACSRLSENKDLFVAATFRLRFSKDFAC